jgi:undecaprenyl diphosphate synthase
MAAHNESPSAGAPASGAAGSGAAAWGAEPGRPLHVAIVMDGNGRWAKKRGLPRTLGHRAGVEALKRTVAAAPGLNIGWLTVFGFSTENWSRPAAEVSELMALPKRYFQSDIVRLERDGVRVRVLGQREGLSSELVGLIDDAEARTAHNERFYLNIAFNYGGQADIVEAARQFAVEVAAGRARPEDLTTGALASRLATAASPPPDVIIRPSGEQRLSNFLLWESAYAEFVFQDVLWPDYGADHLKAALQAFAGRERRYGAVLPDDVLAAG